MMRNEGLQKAIEQAGGQTALARRLTEIAKELGAPRDAIRQSDIWYWLTKRKHGAPAEWCAPIERVTGVPRHLIRPDLYDAPAPLPEDAA